MASRGISLGRIIEWFRTCDAEEGTFALQRAGTILAERKSQLEPARSATRRPKKSHHKPASAPLTHTPQGGEDVKVASA